MAIRHAFTVEEWHRMGDVGLFGDDARVELLDGEVIEMAPIGDPHVGCVNRLTRLLVTAARDGAVVSVQNPVLLSDRSEPQPDVALLHPRSDYYGGARATPTDVLLLVEVSDTTLAYDRDRKVPHYARTGVPESWVVDINGGRILVFRSPSADGYLHSSTATRGDVLGVPGLPGTQISVTDVLGPA